MKSAIFCVLLLLSAPAHAWSEADTKREVGYLLLHAIDWGQTLDISRRCNSTTQRVPKKFKVIPGQDPFTTEKKPSEVVEINPFLGDCPSRSDVNKYFLLTGIAHYAIARALPAKQRRWFQYITISIETGTVARNLNIGVRIRF